MHTIVTIACVALISCLASVVFGQAEMSGWGNLRGIRVDGELSPITTSIVMATPGWTSWAESAHWRTRRSTYERRASDGAIVCTGEIVLPRNGDTLAFKQIVAARSQHSATIDIELTPHADIDLEGVYFFVKVPAEVFGAGSGQLGELAGKRVSFATTRPSNDKHYAGSLARSAKFVSPTREVDVTFDRERMAVFQDDRHGDQSALTLFVTLHDGRLRAQDTVHASMTISTRGEIDRAPAHATIDTNNPGAPFEGLGGNFCWVTESPQVPYYLDNAKIVWARVSFAMALWQPTEDADPTTRPVNAMPELIGESLRIARELHRRKIPMMIAIWSVPDWATLPREDRANPRNQRIDPQKWDAVATSIGQYLLTFKREVGVEPALFSFNESNIGINVLMSPAEHCDMLKRLGAHFESIGLKTKMLLADANEPRGVDYPNVSLADPEAMKYVGMVSYHSWNGGTDEQLRGWRDHARRANVPLTVAEAGHDPDAHQYRNILLEPWYALEEVENYLRCMTHSQPGSLLHWQLTPDYGFLTNDLKPTQRWWQFKQLADHVPAGARHLPTTCDRREITIAALGDDSRDVAVVHISNTGPSRSITIGGISSDARRFRCFVTDATHVMKELPAPIESKEGKLTMTLPAQSFVTLVRAR